METLEVVEPKLFNLLRQEGYSNLVETKNYGIVGVYRFAFTFGLVIGLDECGYDRRYCYKSFEELKVGYNMISIFDTIENPPTHPPDSYWIKCKGHGYDIENPNNPNLNHF